MDELRRKGLDMMNEVYGWEMPNVEGSEFFALTADHLLVLAVELYRDASEVDRVKLRYRSEPIPCELSEQLPAGRYPTIAVMLNEPFMAAAPGQVACLMSGDRVVGHGLIASNEVAHAA